MHLSLYPKQIYAEIGFSPIPVSYTHLDVYKRQVEIVVLYVGFHAVFGHEAVILFGAIAVSYTHLDVYKRQVLRSSCV